MSITATCGGCGKSYIAPEKHAGKRIRCKNCGEIITIPTANAPVSTHAPAAPKVAPRAAKPAAPNPPIRPPSRPAADDAFDNMDALMSLEQTGEVVAEEPVKRRGRPAPPPTPPAEEPADRMLAPASYSPAKLKVRGKKAPKPQRLDYAPPVLTDQWVSIPGEDFIDGVLPTLTLLAFVISSIVDRVRFRPAPFPTMVIGITMGLGIVAVFSAIGVLGVLIASKIMKFRMPPNSFLRMLTVFTILHCIGLIMRYTGLGDSVAMTLASLGTPEARLGGVLIFIFGMWAGALWLMFRFRIAAFAVTAAFVFLCQAGTVFLIAMLIAATLTRF